VNDIECVFACGDCKGTSSNALMLQKTVPETWLLSSSGCVYLVQAVPFYVTWVTLPYLHNWLITTF